MNPIYKFELSDGNTTKQAFPVYKDDLAKDFEKESGQEFFRAKLSGKLNFVSDDYSFIKTNGINTQFVVAIFISYDLGANWTQYWRGTFWKTDCDFDEDSEQVTVNPTVWDQYNDVLAGMDKEYNLIDLAPEIMPIKADKRPMIQVYVPGQQVVGCFLSGMWWEQECEAVNESDNVEIEPDVFVNKLAWLHFTLNKSLRIVEVSQTGTPIIPNIYTGAPYDPATTGATKFTGTEYNFVRSYFVQSGGAAEFFYIERVSDGQNMWYAQFLNQPPKTYPLEVTLNPVDGSGATGTVSIYIHDLNVYSRYVCDTLQINGIDTYPIPAEDLVENNRNYHRVIGYYFPDTIYFSTSLTSTPNKWGLYQPGQYYQPPYLYWGPELFPIARNGWGRVSIWFTFSTFDWLVEESGRQSFTIRHAYPLASVISVLLGKIAPGITHAGTTVYSQFLYGTNLIGIAQHLFITPKSNIISAGYDQPAQKAPITLKTVLDMLRDCFRCYWFIDSNNRFRVEHIQYFRNGGSYAGTPVVGVDLTAETVTRNGKAWSFARNQYKFDKPEMAARYQFGWMDDVTQLFDGFPIDIISKYVNPDNIEQIDISKFTSDIDYILLNPSEISKDGFVLLSAKIINNVAEMNFNPGGLSSVTPGKKIESLYYPNSKRIRSDLYYLKDGIISTGAISGFEYSLVYCDESHCVCGQLTWRSSAYTGSAPSNAKFVLILMRNTSDTDIIPDDLYNVNWQFDGLMSYYLPYLNFIIDGNDHYLQNPFVAFIFLQNYYAYDMPAQRYAINGQEKYAIGVKKLKTQTIKFPMLEDPNLLQLIKTELGNGTIQKMSVNLSSRNANTTLKYDTE